MTSTSSHQIIALKQITNTFNNQSKYQENQEIYSKDYKIDISGQDFLSQEYNHKNNQQNQENYLYFNNNNNKSQKANNDINKEGDEKQQTNLLDGLQQQLKKQNKSISIKDHSSLNNKFQYPNEQKITLKEEQKESQNENLLQSQTYQPQNQNEQQKEQSSQQQLQFSILQLNTYQFNFQNCMPGTVHQKPFTIKLNYDLKVPTNIFVYILCDNQILNSLPEYVFGVRKPNCYQYYDQFKFKVSKKGQFSFIMGTKVPNLATSINNQPLFIQCKLFIWLDGLSDSPIQASLSLSIKTPKIICPKELTLESDIRAIKISAIRNKAKKDCRIPFKVTDSFTDGRALTLQVQVLGMDNINNHLLPPQQQKNNKIQDIQVKPRVLNISGNGQFFLNFGLNFTEQIKTILGTYSNSINAQEQQRPEKRVNHCKVRKIMVIKIKNTNCLYHFPIQACFYNQAKGGNKSQSDNQ